MWTFFGFSTKLGPAFNRKTRKLKPYQNLHPCRIKLSRFLDQSMYRIASKLASTITSRTTNKLVKDYFNYYYPLFHCNGALSSLISLASTLFLVADKFWARKNKTVHPNRMFYVCSVYRKFPSSLVTDIRVSHFKSFPLAFLRQPEARKFYLIWCFFWFQVFMDVDQFLMYIFFLVDNLAWKGV